MTLKNWIIRPSERKQIKLLKIPKEIEEKGNIKDGKVIVVEIKDDDNHLIFISPLTVTSGCEIYLPNNVRKKLEKLNAFTITIKKDEG